jgi:hypothetical protein
VKHNNYPPLNLEKSGVRFFYIWVAQKTKRGLMPAQGEHNKWIALALCILLGYLGLHRFYEGKIWTGILWLCTGGLCGVGIVVDAILIVMKPEHY